MREAVEVFYDQRFKNLLKPNIATSPVVAPALGISPMINP